LKRTNGTSSGGRNIKIMDKNGTVVVESKADSFGVFKTELLQYKAEGKNKIFSAPYTIDIDGNQKTTNLESNTTININL